MTELQKCITETIYQLGKIKQDLLLSSFQSLVCQMNNSFSGLQRANNLPEFEKQHSTPCPSVLISSWLACDCCGSLSTVWENLWVPSLYKRKNVHVTKMAGCFGRGCFCRCCCHPNEIKLNLFWMWHHTLAQTDNNLS